MRPLLLFLAIVALAAPTATAQSTLDVQACVEDEDDGTRLAGAWVRAGRDGGLTTEGTTGADGCVWLTVSLVLDASEVPDDATGLTAGRAYPNPAAHAVRVPVTLGQAQAVEWRLYDLLGRLVRGPLTESLPAGRHVLTVPLDGLPEGRYVYRITGTGGAAGGAVVKAASGTAGPEAPPAALAGAVLLTFEAWRAGYDTLRTEREVETGASVALLLARQRGPGRPLTDVALGETYLGFEGGLYPGGANVPPDAHHRAGVARGREVEPLDLAGNPDPTGRYVFLSIGFSNTTEEFCGEDTMGGPPCQPWSFAGQALADPEVNHTALAFADGARGGLGVNVWASTGSQEYDRIRDEVLAPKELSEAQVQVVWLKVANPAPTVSLPSEDAEAFRLIGQYGDILRALNERYPNLRQVFFSSRNWGGYATTNLHPEPFAYESGYAVKWTIEAQITQMDGGGQDPRAGDLDYTTVAPWAAWGPYLWAEGLRPRSDGVYWAPDAFEADGTHPSLIGEAVVGSLLLEFFKAVPYTRCWFVTGETCGG